MGDQFEKGSVVQLKSGGPKMTVDAVYADGDVRVVWFAGSKMESKVVTQDSLNLFVEPKP